MSNLKYVHVCSGCSLFHGMLLSLTSSHLRHVEVPVGLSLVHGPHFITKPMFLCHGRVSDIAKVI